MEGHQLVIGRTYASRRTPRGRATTKVVEPRKCLRLAGRFLRMRIPERCESVCIVMTMVSAGRAMSIGKLAPGPALRISWMVLLLLSVAFAAGCGGASANRGGSTSKSAAGARATVLAFVAAWKAGQVGDACDLMTNAARKAAGKGDASACGPALLSFRGLIGQDVFNEYEAQVRRRTTVSGNSATAPPMGDPSGTPLRLVYQNGHWLISDQ